MCWTSEEGFKTRLPFLWTIVLILFISSCVAAAEDRQPFAERVKSHCGSFLAWIPHAFEVGGCRLLWSVFPSLCFSKMQGCKGLRGVLIQSLAQGML
jgi:hypothetical protein